ncbi:MAG: LacI family DNA-binding transcriptional regulator [Pseudomonadota bacterium]
MSRVNITIEDVAKAAGVSRQTVSRVINNRTNVAAASRARIEAAIAELGYVPNAAARRMGGARSELILAVIQRGAGAGGAGQRTGRLPLDAMLLAGLDACASTGYRILFDQLETDAASGLTALNRALTALSPDGVILTPPLDERTDLRDAIKGRGIALECLGERVEFGRPAPGLDDGAQGEAATQRLAKLGHRQIAFITGLTDPTRSQRRVAGYHRAMATKGSRAHTHFTAHGQLGFDDARALAKSWLEPTIRPTAIIAETEEVALAVLDVAAQLGVSVPGDLSIIALEDSASLSRSRPPIAALYQPYERLFHESCARLIARAIGTDQPQPESASPDDDDAGDQRAAFKWVERESVTKAPRAV